MKGRARQSVTACLATLASLSTLSPSVFAQNGPFYRVVQNSSAFPSEAIFSQQEFDQMLAPIALYPDSLLTQILMASTYPIEVAEAARWSRDNPGMRGDQAVRAAQHESWEPSVKFLVAFPQVRAMMDDSSDWTECLGDAFLSQESEVWDTVQSLRQRADSAGNLHSGDQLRIKQDGPIYVIEPSRPTTSTCLITTRSWSTAIGGGPASRQCAGHLGLAITLVPAIVAAITGAMASESAPDFSSVASIGGNVMSMSSITTASITATCIVTRIRGTAGSIIPTIGTARHIAVRRYMSNSTAHPATPTHAANSEGVTPPHQIWCLRSAG